MKVENITVTVTPVGNKFKFSADLVVAFGVTETFAYDSTTETFFAGGMKLGGVKKVNF